MGVAHHTGHVRRQRCARHVPVCLSTGARHTVHIRTSVLRLLCQVLCDDLRVSEARGGEAEGCVAWGCRSHECSATASGSVVL